MNADERLQIHELLSRAAHGYDERDIGMLGDCFATDAQMSMRIAGGELIGPFESRQGIMKLMTDSMTAQSDRRRHVVSNIFFSATGEDSATVSSNLSLFATENATTRLITTGVYTDDVVKRDGSWQIARRHLELDAAY